MYSQTGWFTGTRGAHPPRRILVGERFSSSDRVAKIYKGRKTRKNELSKPLFILNIPDWHDSCPHLLYL